MRDAHLATSAPRAREQLELPRSLPVVTDTCFIAGRGLIVAPDLNLGAAAQQRLSVELRRPDGTPLSADALAQVPFIVPLQPGESKRPGHMLLFIDRNKTDTPIGTEIWTTGGSDVPSGTPTAPLTT